MRNPFTVLKSAVSSLFKGRNPAPPVYSRRKARNQRRKARAEVRAFVLKLNRARG